VLFQPHRYTRTRDLMEQFAGAFRDADRVEVLDIYAANEEPISGISGETLAAAICGPKVEYAQTMALGINRLAAEAQEGDVVLTLGAGNVSGAGLLLLEALAETVPA
jgi:UDP-N-acetylmuramate--alanine ligase